MLVVSLCVLVVLVVVGIVLGLVWVYWVLLFGLIGNIYVEVVCGILFIVLLSVIYFGLFMFGFMFVGFLVVVLVLGLYSVVYMFEIVCGGLGSVFVG